MPRLKVGGTITSQHHIQVVTIACSFASPLPFISQIDDLLYDSRTRKTAVLSFYYGLSIPVTVLMQHIE
jgi:hypothetical protein